MKKSRIKLTTSQFILIGFLAVIFVGSILLSLPISSADGKGIPYIDALFTATTSTCVTGLVTMPTFSTFSTVGHVVILLLIQIGGLGIVAVLSGFMLMLNRRLGVADRLLIQDAFNLNTLSGLVRFVKKVFIGTAIIEGIGAILYMPVFIPQFGLRGVWISVFNSVSAFCNAGIDIISENSLCDYALNPLVNFVTAALIVLGGLGYVVWWDVIRVLELKRRKKIKIWKTLSLQSKIVFSATFSFLLIGTVGVFLFEFNNPETFGDFTLPQKLMASFFQSVTTRTAGFATVPQENLTNASALLSVFLMFVGGSPVGTAGGVKTVTMIVIIATAISVVKNKNDVSLFGRRLSETAIRKALAVTSVSFAIALISTIALSAVTDASALDIIYETVSATATVGLTRSLTPSLNNWGKLIIIATMYFGRVGPISLAFALRGKNKNENIIKNPTEEISVG